ncbi:MAG: ABC transporter transmembrane domain-containing protein, partial [Planctomycetota bacterium]
MRAATAYSILNKIFDLAPPALIGTAVDVVVRREQSILAQAGVTSTIAQLWVLCGLTLVIWGLESVFQYAYAVKWRNLAQTIQHDLRVDGYTHLQKLELGFFEDERSGRLMAILNDDVNQLERFLDSGASALIQVVTTVIVIGTIFFALAPGVAIFAMLPMPIVLYGSIRYQRLLLPRYREVRERASLINGQLEANLRGIATIKSFTAEEKERERIARLSMDYRVANREAIRFSSMFSPLIRMVIVVGFIATLALGGWLSLNGRLAVGAYSVLVFMTQRLLWP